MHAQPLMPAGCAGPRLSRRFLASRLLRAEAPPPGVSLTTVLLALAQCAAALGAHKLERFAYGRLQARAPLARPGLACS